jgi:hypothetical protein
MRAFYNYHVQRLAEYEVKLIENQASVPRNKNAWKEHDLFLEELDRRGRACPETYKPKLRKCTALVAEVEDLLEKFKAHNHETLEAYISSKDFKLLWKRRFDFRCIRASKTRKGKREQQLLQNKILQM